MNKIELDKKLELLKRSLDSEATNFIDFIHMKMSILSDDFSDKVDNLYNDYVDQLDQISKSSNDKMIEFYDNLKDRIDDIKNSL